MKQKLTDLAILGGEPQFSASLHVGCPNIGSRERFMARVATMLDSRRLSNNGPFVQELEAVLAERLGVRHCIAVCNGTLALEISIRALGLQGEVIVPSFTFVATAHALQWQGIKPVFCDVDARTHTIDPRRVESLITQRTTGIIGVHTWGQPCAIAALKAIANRHRLALMFDASHAYGCALEGRAIGAFGALEVFSLHATKVLNTFEGGAIATNDDELARKLRRMRNFGFSGPDSVIHIGTNGKMTEVAAAMGLTNLENLPAFLNSNRRNFLCYQRWLRGIRGLRLFRPGRTVTWNHQYVVVEVESARFGSSRDTLLRILHAENVLARRYFYPGCHRMEPYRSDFPASGAILRETENLSRRVLVLPTGTAVTPKDIEAICQMIRVVSENPEEVQRGFEAPRDKAERTNESPWRGSVMDSVAPPAGGVEGEAGLG